MKPYVLTQVPAAAVEALSWAEHYVQNLPDEIPFEVRCHELARAVHRAGKGDEYGWEVVDGHLGPVEHTWIALFKQPLVLDVYAPGRLPMVQLVDLGIQSIDVGLSAYYGAARPPLPKMYITAGVSQANGPRGIGPFEPTRIAAAWTYWPASEPRQDINEDQVNWLFERMI